MTTPVAEVQIALILRRLGACPEAVEWAESYGVDAVRAWVECPRGDWLLWLWGQEITSPPWSDERKPLLACALDCALTVRNLWLVKDREKICAAVETMKAWCRGEVIAEVAMKASVSLARAYYASAYYATAAARSCYADSACYAVAYSAREAADAASVAGAAGDAREKVLSQCADIVRQHRPTPPPFAFTDLFRTREGENTC